MDTGSESKNQISFEGLRKDGPPKKPSKLICIPNLTH